MGLFKGKKPDVEPETRRRAVRQNTAGRPDFAYYANRRPSRTSENPAAVGRSRSLLNAPVGVKSPAKKRFRTIVWVVFVGLAVVLAGQLLLLTPNSKVELLSEGNETSVGDVSVYQSTVDQLLASQLLNRSKITVDTHGITKALKQKHPEVETAVITVPWVGSQPTVHISLSAPVFVLQQGSSRFVLSRSGYVVGTAASDVDLPLIVDETNEPVSVGTQLLPPSHVRFIQVVAYQLQQANIGVKNFALPSGKVYELDARLNDKRYILRFNFEEDAMQQSGAAIATLEQLGSTSPEQYIDLRVPGRVYYK